MNYVNKLLFITLFAWFSMPITVYTIVESIDQDESIENAQMNDFHTIFFNSQRNFIEGFSLIGVDLQSFQKQAFVLLADIKLKYKQFFVANKDEQSFDAQIKSDLNALLQELGFPESFIVEPEFQETVAQYIQNAFDTYFCKSFKLT